MSRASAELDLLGMEKLIRSRTFNSLPVLNPASMPVPANLSSGSAPLTIFYNGTVTVFDVPEDKAEAIMKLAKESQAAAQLRPSLSGCEQGLLMEKLNGDTLLPVARRKSLQRFLEKRKQSERYLLRSDSNWA